jgi:hypothetical protein
MANVVAATTVSETICIIFGLHKKTTTKNMALKKLDKLQIRPTQKSNKTIPALTKFPYFEKLFKNSKVVGIAFERTLSM